jgi:hypothetical protein
MQSKFYRSLRGHWGYLPKYNRKLFMSLSTRKTNDVWHVHGKVEILFLGNTSHRYVVTFSLQQQSSFFSFLFCENRVPFSISNCVDFIMCCVFIKKVLCHNMQGKKNNPSVNSLFHSKLDGRTHEDMFHITFYHRAGINVSLTRSTNSVIFC